MPPLNELMGSSLKGFAPVENPVKSPPAEIPGRAVSGNPWIRCPLPPFNAGPDTLRQFDEGGKVPTKRVIPLPPAQAGGITNVTTNTNVIETGGGSGGGGTTKLTAATAVVNAPVLAPGGVFQTIIQMSKSFQLLSISATSPVEVRIYGSSSAQSADIARLTDTAVPFEIISNIITDVVFDTAPFTWNWQNRIGANADDPQSLNVYVSVVNPSQSTGSLATIVTINYLPLES